MPRWMVPFLASALAVFTLGACGSSHRPATSPTSTASSPASTPAPPPAVSDLSGAEHPSPAEFPRSQGRSLKQLALLAQSVAQLGAANGTFVPGRQRLAFALTTSSQAYIYAPTAIYIARTPSAPAVGPYLAPADSMVVPPQDRSQQNSAPGGLRAIYWTELPLAHAGVYYILALTRVGASLTGSTGEVAVASSSPIPDVGQRPPDIATDTLASVHGHLALLTTRLPPEQMHSVSLDQVLGKRPVALLFSTPQLCTSRICGPVTDEAVALQHQFAGRVVFIHEEVYVDNQPTRGLRPQLKTFHLETEPWLFTINRHGVIVGRLEGAFGLGELRRALQAAVS
ncbi:MAG: hypothetical protein JO244_10730 [Solirubrobacterales bacterium]|nr:hypothetical protein [Solirubrobacterales bacterium]